MNRFYKFVGLSALAVAFFSGCSSSVLKDVSRKKEYKNLEKRVYQSSKGYFKERVVPWVNSLSNKGWVDFQKLADSAYKELGISFLHRYGSFKNLTTLLKEVVFNYKHPEVDTSKDLAIGFFTKRDSSNMLSWNSSCVTRLIPGYELLIFEVDSVDKIKTYLKRVKDRFPEQKIGGMIIAGHGTKTSIDLGVRDLTIDNLAETFYKSKDKFTKDALIVFPNCSNGEGGDDEVNLANVASKVFLGRQVYACSYVCWGINFDLGKNNKVIPSSIHMNALVNGWWPFWNGTYNPVLKKEELSDYDLKLQNFWKKGFFPFMDKKSLDFYTLDEIAKISRIAKKKGYQSGFVVKAAKEKIPAEKVIGYMKPGLYSFSLFKKFLKENIEPRYLQKAISEGFSINEIFESHPNYYDIQPLQKSVDNFVAAINASSNN